MVDAELWFEQVVDGEPGPAAAGKLRWDDKQEQRPVRAVRRHGSATGGRRRDVPGVSTTTDMVMSEQTATMTSREMAMPFQFLWVGLTSTYSCRGTETAGQLPARGKQTTTATTSAEETLRRKRRFLATGEEAASQAEFRPECAACSV